MERQNMLMFLDIFNLLVIGTFAIHSYVFRTKPFLMAPFPNYNTYNLSDLY